MSAGDAVTLHARTWASLVIPERVRFLPLADLAPNPDAFFRAWQLMEVVFDLPDPADFPPLGGFDPRDRMTLQRFVASCEDLAESTAIAHGSSMKIQIPGPGVEEEITLDVPPREAMRGTVVLFRQLHSPEEKASFRVVSGILSKRVQQVHDARQGTRKFFLDAWRRAHADLNADSLDRMADVVGYRRSGGRADPPGPELSMKPQELISLFQYGDLIHWGRKRDLHAALIRDEYDFAQRNYEFVGIVFQLCHFYMGYSVLVRAALGTPRRITPPGS